MSAPRTFAGIATFGSYVAFASLTTLVPGARLRRTARLRLNRFFARTMNRAIGLEITSNARPRRDGPNRGRLILANHASLLDVFALASLADAVFVTSLDVTESPAIRRLATIGGVAFIERRHRENRDAELAELESLLQDGRTVVLFPEATSTDGSEILRFRNGLLHAAFRVPGVEIVPICLQYRAIGDAPVTAANRDRIFLYGETTIAAHLGRLFTNPRVKLSAEFFAPIPARDFENARTLAAHAEFLVRSVYRPIRAAASEPVGPILPSFSAETSA
jgi:1-acyl-sn-glycerol-3-phosphate acyltransferase